MGAFGHQGTVDHAVHKCPPAAVASFVPALRRPMAWLLDIDGTLVLTDEIYLSVFAELLRPYGYEVDLAWYMENVHGKNDREVFSHLFPDATEDELQRLSVQKDACFREKARLLGMKSLAGLPEALALAKREGVRCIAVSNAPRAACECALQCLKDTIAAADVIDGLVVGAECLRPKPFPDPYLVAMELIGRSPSECIVFEDSGSGVASAVAAGVAAVIGIRSSLSDSDLRRQGATVTVVDWRAVDAKLLNSVC
ncbi:hypothetical protein AB1Y20_011445 [Prymnesium parvum]|uniref:Uncharacterized protein n=1 Tax=Prymnesium parvum TaxID=97485 RepID=A0AB34IPP7_PRYPA|mmetsp:Transcript_4368/g.10884  ORF Transcript_4368/g.10884 Transcript_4368/m.10884 type:complete len:254 (-) Transcript_4368:251-1012(-)|eukprot:CAMPEP_0113272240 /NCGR_PEP_ID=MMETSP0008_2-20120614/23217_1 /TAXON_ID=97485 /ORGANISM="Prymnesium parvum" /LENGTH=253 /DNA_ID=CAMNT_0000121687 /DNA_START=145 /DNA_END=906 /DNA_ORIENTATION=- /assembly_acc=CAM_ASM_000153